MNKPRISHFPIEFLSNKNFQAVLVLTLFLAVFYRDVVFLGKTFLMETAAPGTMPNNAGPYKYKGEAPGFVANDPGAIAWQIEPFNRFITKSIKNGDFPLWNPYAGLAGSPLLADGHTGPLEPIQFIFFFFPIRFWANAIDLQLLLRFLIAGYGCFLFAQRLKLDFWGSITTGVLFMLSSYFVTYGNHPQVKTEVLLPLVLYGYDRLADLDDKVGIWLSSLFIGWAIIAAMPESTFFALMLGSLWYFYRVALYCYRSRLSLTSLKIAALRYLVASILGFSISAVYLLPFLEFLSVSNHVHSAGSGIISLPLWSLTKFLFQVNGSFPSQIGFFSFFSFIYLILCFPNLQKNRDGIVFFGIYAVLALLSIFDFSPTNWIKSLPVLNQIVLLKYALPSIVFSLAIFAGTFVDMSVTGLLSYKKITWSLLIIVVLFVELPVLGNPYRTFGLYFVTREKMLSSIGYLFMASLVVFLISYLYAQKDISKRVVPVAFLFLAVSGPLFSSEIINRPDRSNPYQAPPFMDYLRKDKDLFRIFALNGILYPNVSTAYNVYDARWLNALVPKRAYGFSTNFIESQEPKTSRLTGTAYPVSDEMFDLLNIKYVLIASEPRDTTNSAIIQGLSSPNYYSAYQDNDVEIYENRNVISRAFMVYDVINVKDFDSAITKLSSLNVDIRQQAVVENLSQEVEQKLAKNIATGSFVIKGVKQISSGELVIDITSSSPGMLILTDQYYPGWTAYVNGVESPIYAVDAMFRGVFLEKGNYVVKFKYQPLTFLVGCCVSIIALISVLILLSVNSSYSFMKKKG